MWALEEVRGETGVELSIAVRPVVYRYWLQWHGPFIAAFCFEPPSSCRLSRVRRRLTGLTPEILDDIVNVSNTISNIQNVRVLIKDLVKMSS
jgi:hypothetical protein